MIKWKEALCLLRPHSYGLGKSGPESRGRHRDQLTNQECTKVGNKTHSTDTEKGKTTSTEKEMSFLTNRAGTGHLEGKKKKVSSKPYNHISNSKAIVNLNMNLRTTEFIEDDKEKQRALELGTMN